jgi:alpha-amylase
VPDVCFGFEAHQPYRLNRLFSSDSAVKSDRLLDLYFDQENKEILSRVTKRCYSPVSATLLSMLDEGFRCAFSFSGILIDQLERWEPDTLELFRQIAWHKGTELIAQPYYHSVAGCFDGKWEFKSQVRKHLDLLGDLFKRRPAICMNTELMLNNEMAGVIQRSGFRGALTEGAPYILSGQSSNHLYLCRDLPVLLRNPRLSDDIALRFADLTWDQYPLTADTYAAWIASSPGEAVTVFLNCETFGEHIGAETGIFDFLGHLPEQCQEQHIDFILPSEIIDTYTAIGTLDIPMTISWADVDKGTSAWMGNERQRTAFAALQSAETYAMDPLYWRYLQAIDHFYGMASSYGSSQEVHAYRALQDPEQTFETFMRVLADYEQRAIPLMNDPNAARILRTLSREQAFQFASPTGSVGHTAFNLVQFQDQLDVVPLDSIQYHQERGDFSRWIRETLMDPGLSESIGGCTERHEMVSIIGTRIEELHNRLT